MDPLLSGWEKFEDSKGVINSRKGETDHSMSKGVGYSVAVKERQTIQWPKG